MIAITDALKEKLLAAENAGAAAEIMKAEGCELTSEEAALLWEEIGRARDGEGRQLSKDELAAVSGGGLQLPESCNLFFG